MSTEILEIVKDRSPLQEWLLRFRPVQAQLGLSERVSAWLGALIGISVTGFVSRAWLGSSETVPLLIAPIGASSVLVFGVPASPLAQPWSVMGGNVIAALVGVTCLRMCPDPLLAAALAVATTIALTSVLGCLHPPAGAVALTAVIGGPAIAQTGYHFALVPVALNSALLVGVALVFNNLTRRSYPHVAAPLPVSQHHTADTPPEQRMGFTVDDLDTALSDLGTRLDVSREDLFALFHQVERLAQRRLHGVIRCVDIMSRDLITVTPDTTTTVALAKLRHHALRILPVLDEQGRVGGAIDLPLAASAPDAVVASLPSLSFELAREDTPIDEVLPLLSDGHAHEVMILDAHDRLVGIVTQTDLLAVLYRSKLAQANMQLGSQFGGAASRPAAPRSLEQVSSALRELRTASPKSNSARRTGPDRNDQNT